MKAVLPLLLLLTTSAGARDNNFVVFVGAYTDSGSKGIYSFRFNSDSGSMTPMALAATSDNPSFMVIDPTHRFLYAANEIEKFAGKSDGSVSVFAIDPKTRKLSPVQQVSSGGWGPVYLSLDKAGRYLMVANYGAGSITTLPIGTDGRLGAPTASIQHTGTKDPRPHAIEATKDDRFALVPDLGLDQLFVYRFNPETGALALNASGTVKLPPNTGPRHIAIAPSGKIVYLTNEEASTVTVFSFDPAHGTLVEKQTVSTLPADSKVQNTTAEIGLDPTGKFLYVSNRGEDTIVLFNVDPKSGKLTPVDRTPSGGKTPRTFAIDPTGKWMLVANQGSNTIDLLKRDPRSGRLSQTSRSLSVAAPAHLAFVPAP
jgi:6-phosphogluconolactonase